MEGVVGLQACRQPTNSHSRCDAAILVSRPAHPAHPCTAPLSSSSGMRAGVAALAWRSPSSGSSGTPRPVRYLRKWEHRNNQQNNSSTHRLNNQRSRQHCRQCMRSTISCIQLMLEAPPAFQPVPPACPGPHLSASASCASTPPTSAACCRHRTASVSLRGRPYGAARPLEARAASVKAASASGDSSG